MSDFLPAVAKQELRVRLTDARLAESSKNSELAHGLAEQLTNWLADHGGLRPGVVVASYLAFGTEPDVSEFNRRVLDAGGQLLIPVSNVDHSLTWINWDGVNTQPGIFKFAEPVGQPANLNTAKALVIPALAADLTGNRLGKGKGFYDRELASVTCPVAAVVFDSEVFDSITVEEHDKKVDAVVTPSRVIQIESR